MAGTDVSACPRAGDSVLSFFPIAIAWMRVKSWAASPVYYALGTKSCPEHKLLEITSRKMLLSSCPDSGLPTGFCLVLLEKNAGHSLIQQNSSYIPMLGLTQETCAIPIFVFFGFPHLWIA